MITSVSEQLREFTEDHNWIDRNESTLLEKYAEQWIAVKNKNVIASDTDFESLQSKLADPSHTCIEFLSHEPLEMML
jgi:hypothetical protein